MGRAYHDEKCRQGNEHEGVLEEANKPVAAARPLASLRSLYKNGTVDREGVGGERLIAR
jgi:hypothetical protein